MRAWFVSMQLLSRKVTSDQIFSLEKILERGREYHIQTYHLIVDFKPAYDSLNRPALYKAIEEPNIPRELIHLTKMTMTYVYCMVSIQGGFSETFVIQILNL